jgi:hypothetical protein
VITNDQIRELLKYARAIEDQRLVACAMRALDGDSVYNTALRERCAAAYAGAHTSSEFLAAVGRLSAESVTDDQIRELRDSTTDRYRKSLCNLALMAPGGIGVKHEYREARAVCAEILNIRAQEDQ